MLKRYLLVPIHPEGWPFITLFAVATLLLHWLWSPLGWLGAILTLWCAYFFRNPDRVTPTREGLVISPADGYVQLVDAAKPPAELGMGDGVRPRVCVFMSVFDVHVNRIPHAGKVGVKFYRPGLFLNASLDKASDDNERMAVRLDLEDGRDLAFVQIAGLVARRIVCPLSEGENVRTGERFGLIRFGSRVDVYLPVGVAPLVAVGQRAIAGETVLADLAGSEPARTGEIR
ncbi:MAG: phosphatidylserine decarboxylase [Rhodospirillales bacterium]|jgi:phosphatidylserine decarboxylase|nr:phosphatidylserine decarboxylase [Rhodospirillales bacterium]